MRFEEEKDSTTQLFVKKNFLMYPKKIWNWVKDYKGKVDEMDQNSIVNDVIDFLQYVEGNNYGKLRNQRVQTAVITSCIDGIQKRKIQEAGLNTEVFEIDGSIDRAHCGTTHSDVVCNSEQVFDFNSESKDQLPKCAECMANMRPNIRYRHEEDDEILYQSESAPNFVKQADCMIVIG